MECLYENGFDCPYFDFGKCLLEDEFEPCVMDYTENGKDDSYDWDDIYNDNWLEGDSYDYDD